MMIKRNLLKKYFIIGWFLYFNIFQVRSQITPPDQPSYGPGGNNYSYQTVDSSRYGTNIYDMYWLFEPNSPKPDSLPIIVLFHGTLYDVDSNIAPNYELQLIHHFVRKGYVVIFPLYQYGGNTLNNDDQLTNAGNVLNMALSELDNGAHVKPKRDKNGKIMIGVTGYSRGGNMSMAISNNHTILGLPAFDAVADFVAANNYETMQGISANTKIIIVLAQDDSYDDAPIEAMYAAWDSLYFIACENKNFLTVHSDSTGSPVLTADHPFFVTNANYPSSVNALDYYGSWKLCVGLFNCAFYGSDCDYALGMDSNVTYMGTWSNGHPVDPITFNDTCSFSSIQEIKNATENIRIYPNPIKDHAAIYWPKDLILNNASLKLYDLYGEMVVNIQSISENGIQINIQQLQKGMYLYSFSNNLLQLYNGKIIIQ